MNIINSRFWRKKKNIYIYIYIFLVLFQQHYHNIKHKQIFLIILIKMQGAISTTPIVKEGVEVLFTRKVLFILHFY